MTAPWERRSDCPRCDGRGWNPVVDGESLRTEREAIGLSLREVARRCKISASYLSDIELGRRQPSAATRAALKNALR